MSFIFFIFAVAHSLRPPSLSLSLSLSIYLYLSKHLLYFFISSPNLFVYLFVSFFLYNSLKYILTRYFYFYFHFVTNFLSFFLYFQWLCSDGFFPAVQISNTVTLYIFHKTCHFDTNSSWLKTNRESSNNVGQGENHPCYRLWPCSFISVARDQNDYWQLNKEFPQIS